MKGQSVKEKVIHESINRITKRIKAIDDLLDATPAIDIINLRKEFYFFDKKLGNRFCKEFDNELKRVSKEEKRLFALHEKINKKGYVNLLDEKSELSMELFELESELSQMDLRRKIREGEFS